MQFLLALLTVVLRMFGKADDVGTRVLLLLVLGCGLVDVEAGGLDCEAVRSEHASQEV